MPRQALPNHHVAGSACYHTIPAGTLLWRMHQSRHPADSFAPPRPDPIFTGARFDGTSLYGYDYYYAAETPQTALAEVLLRRREFTGVSGRLITREEVAGRRLSAVVTTTALKLVSLLSMTDLAAVSQDDWLLNSDDEGLAYTRAWAGQLWKAEPEAQGLIWMSRRNMPERAIMLFGGRCGRTPLQIRTHETIDLDDPAGLARANEMLRPFRASIDPDPKGSLRP